MAFFQGKHLWINQLEDGVADLRFGGGEEAVSLLSPALLDELEGALDALERANSFRLLFLHLGRPARGALGLDLDVLSKLESPEAWMNLAQRGQMILRRLADLPLPSVAMLSATCLGPELQLALACDYRILIEKPGTVLAFQELELGLMPFWGATHRLPRLIGLEPSLRVLLTARRIRPAEALRLGLVDAVAAEGGDMPDFLESPVKQARHWLPKRTWRQWLVESMFLGRWMLFRGANRLVQRRFPQDMPGASFMIEALRRGLRRGADAAEKLEAESIAHLGTLPAWRHLLNLHRRREAIRAAHVPKDRKDRFRQIGLIGVDGRGGALAVLAATRNCQVLLQEKDDLSLGLGLMVVLNLFEQEIKRGGLNPAEMKKNLNAIKATTNYRDFTNLELVLLGGDEKPDTLRNNLQNLENKVGPNTLIASTDPTTPVDNVTKGMRRPERFAVLHFQVPAGRSLLVEVVPSANMPEGDVRRLMEWVAHLGRTPRRVPSGPGFLYHRLLLPSLLEAIRLVKEGIRPDRIDPALIAFGMVHGPLEQMDLMGVDTIKTLADTLLLTTWGTRIPPEDALGMMVQNNWLGQKAEVGFYRYRRGRAKIHYRLMAELRDRGRRERAEHLDVLSQADQKRKAVDRLVLLWVNEAARCLEEGYISDPAELDLTMTLGGWAPHRGGPLAYARDLGKEKVLETMRFLEEHHGERYRPSPWLLQWLEK